MGVHYPVFHRSENSEVERNLLMVKAQWAEREKVHMKMLRRWHKKSKKSSLGLGESGSPFEGLAKGLVQADLSGVWAPIFHKTPQSRQECVTFAPWDRTFAKGSGRGKPPFAWVRARPPATRQVLEAEGLLEPLDNLGELHDLEVQTPKSMPDHARRVKPAFELFRQTASDRALLGAASPKVRPVSAGFSGAAASRPAPAPEQDPSELDEGWDDEDDGQEYDEC